MLRMMIVDDEKIIRDGISTIIDWESYGITIACVCKDGLEAYDMIIDEYPDIIITDIKMPGLDGLSLINRAQTINKKIKFIILSGYSEFELAREAMLYGVRNYLLKPCNENQLIEAVHMVQQEILSEQKDDYSDSNSTLSIDKSNEYKDIIKQTIKYSEENLSNPQLTLKWLAENYLFMNVDYISRTFLKETGEKYSAFLNRLRMEKAKELILQVGDDHIYLVAEQVGCGNNPQYFSQIFKKCYGITPSQYRDYHKKSLSHRANYFNLST